MSEPTNGTKPSVPPNHHLAALLPSPGTPHTLVPRPTPSPSPTSLLVAVHAAALNLLDWAQRDTGFALTHLPTVLGADLSGVILAVGAEVDTETTGFKPGARVAALGDGFYTGGVPDGGGFQEVCCVPAAHAVVLPDGIGWNEGATLPLAVATAWAGLYTLGLALPAPPRPGEGRGMLVWGAASSMGALMVQVARVLGYRVYATASPKHHGWIQGLGVEGGRVWDYKALGVVEGIVERMREDGLGKGGVVGYDAVGSLEECVGVLKAFPGGEGEVRVASAARVDAGTDVVVEGVRVKFVQAPADETERGELWRWVFNVWLREELGSGEVVPAPEVRVVEGGLAGVDKGLDELRGGVSGCKLVVEVRREGGRWGLVTPSLV